MEYKYYCINCRHEYFTQKTEIFCPRCKRINENYQRVKKEKNIPLEDNDAFPDFIDVFKQFRN
jgi:Zn finger protein HypA/HybF involved in hydrogenase expression